MVQTQILNNPRRETYGLDDDDDDLPVRIYDQPKRNGITGANLSEVILPDNGGFPW